MNKVFLLLTGSLSRVIAVIAIACAIFGQSLAQTTPADTQIHNQATATYSDGSGGSYSTVSNTVTVTVAKVSGLRITPDAQVDPTVVPGQTGLSFNFVVTNTGNFSDQVQFLTGGNSLTLTGPGVITSAFIDVNSDGIFNGTDVNIFTNGADELYTLAQNGSVNVVVRANVNLAANAGQIVQVYLGDADNNGPNFDNEPADSSANEVRTVSTASVNGIREARGDRSVTVANDAILDLSLTAPGGPVPLSSVITYNWQLCNTGNRPASSITLTNVTGGPNSGVFIIAPIPVGTAFDATQSFPPGVSVLYSTSPLSDNPITTAAWDSTQPGTLASIRRVAFHVGNSLAAAACSPVIDMRVLITTTDATNSISQQGDAYATNSLAVQITDQSQLRLTTLLQVGSVLNGPAGQPGAVGPTNTTNDDYTNKSVNTGIAGVPPGGVTTAAGNIVSFTNTVRNTGNANDNFTLTVTSFPAGATVVVNGVTVVNLGTPTGASVPALAIAFGAQSDYTVAVTLPAGMTVLTGYDTVIRATSGITTGSTNDTIDRVYTGFIRLDKSFTVTNSTGVGGANDAVPGAVITYTITYTNVSSSGGTNNVTLTATTIVITEDGAALPNNWATYTDHVVGATDPTPGAVIVGDAVGSNLLTDTIPSLGAGQSGVFTFLRQIK